jgi:hypothetical protein
MAFEQLVKLAFFSRDERLADELVPLEALEDGVVRVEPQGNRPCPAVVRLAYDHLLPGMRQGSVAEVVAEGGGREVPDGRLLRQQLVGVESSASVV